jgi:hypothetical protein
MFTELKKRPGPSKGCRAIGKKSSSRRSNTSNIIATTGKFIQFNSPSSGSYEGEMAKRTKISELLYQLPCSLSLSLSLSALIY